MEICVAKRSVYFRRTHVFFEHERHERNEGLRLFCDLLLLGEPKRTLALA